MDGSLLPLSDILFNDPAERSFKTQCFFQNINEANIIPDDAEESIKTAFEKACSLLDQGSDWEFIREFTNFFPDRFLSILEEAFPVVTRLP